ncbi:cell division protein [Boudabousia liubingyangii]|uniref:FtsW/RodA/SpoVE family cell cycle protein n=1 Tax=Boudabousia liubingyangii TaxID=1921764 RepID=UPI00093DFF71|nr:FtsW/RodA/SpoVE family cell cycle protein [Boudabousia liubingyangii]OKL48529.1 cell division protein [Boudabousia liubingyangii]
MATVSVKAARPGRLSELLLMLLAVALGVGGYAATAYSRSGSLPENFALHIGVLVAVAIAATLIVRWLVPYADPVILPVTVALNGIGLAMIYRIDQSYIAKGGGALKFVVGTRQLLWTGLGLLTMMALLFFIPSHRRLRSTPMLWMLFSLILLVSPAIPGLGRSVNGARIWIGFGPIRIQPAELVKVTLAIAFAAYLVAYRDRLKLGGTKILGLRFPRAKDMGPLLSIWVLSLGVLVFQRDLGTSLLFFGLFVAMLYVATDQVSWIIIGFSLFAVGAASATRIFPHVQYRFDVWLHTFDPEVYSRAAGGSWQLAQAQFGMAFGGLFGTGWGKGYPAEVYAANSDMILASLGEELGLTGLLAILLLYLILVERGIRAAVSVRDGFGKLLATGLSFSIALQLFVVGGGIFRIIPLTGLTAPFLAAGGSSLISSWIVIALLLRVSDAARRPASDPSSALDSMKGGAAVEPANS